MRKIISESGSILFWESCWINFALDRAVRRIKAISARNQWGVISHNFSNYCDCYCISITRIFPAPPGDCRQLGSFKVAQKLVWRHRYLTFITRSEFGIIIKSQTHSINSKSKKSSTILKNYKSFQEKKWQPSQLPSDLSTSLLESTEFLDFQLNTTSHFPTLLKRNLPDLASEPFSASSSSSSSKSHSTNANILLVKNDTISPVSSVLKSTPSKFGSRTDESDFEKPAQILKPILLAALPTLSNLFMYTSVQRSL